jgi:hypothetical protein
MRMREWGYVDGSVVIVLPGLVLLTLASQHAAGQQPPTILASQPDYRPSPEQLKVFVDRLTDIAVRKHGLDDVERSEMRARIEKTVEGMLQRSRQLRMAAAAMASEATATHGIWPTLAMWHRVADAMVDDMGPGYGFNASQKDLLKDWLKRIALPRLEGMRGTLEPSIGEIMVQYASGRVPTSQAVIDWSRQLLPCLHELGVTWEEAYRYMLPHLRPEQRNQWRKAYFVFKLGFDMGESKLRSVAQGNFDMRELYSTWPGAQHGKEKIIEQARSAGIDPTPPPGLERTAVSEVGNEVAGTAGPQDEAPPSGRGAVTVNPSFVPLDRWQNYTRRFIVRHRLDEGQKTSAMAILKEVRDRASAYRRSHENDFQRLHEAIRKAQGDAKTGLQDELAQLERPLQELYDEFSGRLDQILTEAQRRAADSGR